jgi:oligopeptide transport system substrate-binding protein
MNRIKNSLRVIPALAIVLAMVLGAMPAFASDAEITLTSVMQDDEYVTHYTSQHGGSQISSLDPQVATDSVSITYIENLFLGLTDNNAVTAAIEPELATDWSYDEETYTWTFTVRDDVPWVQWDPVTDTATELRKVVAGDFVTGIRRACDPNNPSLYSEVVGSNIVGCSEVYAMDPADVTPETFEMVGVAAPDDTTLQITLVGPIGYFFSMSGMWTLRAVPGEIIDEYGEPVGGDAWIQPGAIVTNGPFVLDEWERGVRRVLIANPLLPADLRGPGNVERVIDTAIDDGGTNYALYQDGQIDFAGVPSAELQNVLADPELSQEVVQQVELVVFYFGFGHDKAPFDDVHVRRAFSASVNRELFVSEIRQGRGVPMMHLTPPGMFGAVPVNEVGIDGEGIGYDPAFAQSEIEAAGYPNCEGLPDISVVTYQGAADWAEFVQAEVENSLGCDPSLFTIEQQEFSVLLRTTSSDTPTEERPNMWTLGWGPDYPDANNWVFDAGLHCESSNDFMRPCEEVDDMIYEAQTEGDPEVRAQMYAEIEEAFFGYEGTYPIMPLFMRANFWQLKPWLDKPIETDGLFGGEHWDWISIDSELQAEGRS